MWTVEPSILRERLMADLVRDSKPMQPKQGFWFFFKYGSKPSEKTSGRWFATHGSGPILADNIQQ